MSMVDVHLFFSIHIGLALGYVLYNQELSYVSS